MSAVTGRVTLSKPVAITLRGAKGDEVEHLHELVLRKPVAGDLRVMDMAEGPTSGMIAFIAHLTGQPIETIDGLPGRDFQALVMKLNAMKADAWPAGSVPSLTVREPLARDLRIMDQHQGQHAQVIALVAHLAGVDVARVAGLEVGEFEHLQEMAQGFTPPGPSTGEIASEN